MKINAGRTEKTSIWKRIWKLPQDWAGYVYLGNVSEIDRRPDVLLSNQAAFHMRDLKPEDMVILDLEGNKIEGQIQPVPLIRRLI